MIENPVILSLGSWPTQPCESNLRVSPTTLRVIRNVKIQIQSLLPLSFVQFSVQNNTSISTKNELEQQYHRELQRRKKKVEILQGIWNKIKQRRAKSAQQTFSAKQSKLVKNIQNPIKRSICKSFYTQQRKSRSRSPLIYKGKSPTKGSTYFDYYNTNKQTKVMKKISYQEQSTKSRRQKTSNASRTNQEYFQKNGSKKSLTKYSSRQKQSWLVLMSEMMKKWEQMDNKHSQQLSQLGDLQQHERKRLLKIHQIEREKLKKQIQNMKSKMYSHKRLNKGF